MMLKKEGKRMEIGNSFLIKNFTNSVWCMKPSALDNMVKVINSKYMNDPKILAALIMDKEIKNERSNIVTKQGNTAIVNIEGTLVPKCSWLDAACGLVSTFEIMSQVEILELDYSIDKVIYYIDTPGGVINGIGELAELINNSSKNTIAYADNMACSAGYVLASSAKRFYTLPSAEIGSIGACVTLIKEKNTELDYFIMGEGEQKLFGNPNVPVTNDELNFYKDKVHESYEWINNTVAKYRSIDVESVKSTKSGYFMASVAPEWMIDGQMTSSELFKKF
jgi:ClpP class serine protease